MSLHLPSCVFYLADKTVILKLLQVLVHGQPGEEIKLELILRVVADVGLIVSIASIHSAIFSSPRVFLLLSS
jgi:hypothetical protein